MSKGRAENTQSLSGEQGQEAGQKGQGEGRRAGARAGWQCWPPELPGSTQNWYR